MDARNRPIKILWYGSGRDADGNPLVPSISPNFEKRLDGLNEGELYVYNDDAMPSIFIRTNKDRIVAISGNNIEELEKLFIRKDKDDTGAGNYTFAQAVDITGKATAGAGIQIGKTFIPGILTGSGGFFDEYANGEVESLIIRRFLEVPELRFNRVQITLGDKWNAPGAGIIERVVPDVNADGTPSMSGTGYLKLEEGEYGSIAVGDISMGIFHSEKSSENASADEDDSRGNFKFAGFYTTYFTITSVSGDNNGTFRYQLRPVSDRWKLVYHPCSAMHFVCYGSFTDTDRQTSQYTTRTYTRLLWKQNTWEISAGNIAMQWGDLTNMNIHGLDMTGYSVYLNNVYFTGTIKQVKPDGTPVLTANDRGAWTSGTKYDFYDRVSHDGSIWLCVNESGTSSEPGAGNADWLLQVEKGAPGAPGGEGPQGVPGVPGADGKTLYTWIKYADDASGGGISNNPSGKEYIGMAYNKDTAAESGNPSDYTWSLIKGTDGVPGTPGADGKTYYTWIAYSDNPDGSGMYQVPNDKTRYIGIAVNKDTAVESSNPSDYTWSLFKGADGESVEMVGEWHTGLVVPVLGITTMGGNSYMAKVATTNPPLWCWTDNNGNRLIYNAGGYCLTGEQNTAEYDLLVQSGQDGKDGKDYEWIFAHTATNSKPATPATSQTNDYVPSGWSDDAIGVSATLPYEWACKRTKSDGVWSAFSEPSLWANYSFDAVSADLSNEMDNIALDEDGKTVDASVITTVASMWNGQTELSLSSLSVKDVTGISSSYDLSTGVITFTIAKGTALADRTEINLTVKATADGTEQTRNMVFTLAGIKGGKNAVLYSLVTSASSIVRRKDGTYSVSGISATRMKTVGGVSQVTTDGTLKYAIDNGTENTVGNGTSIDASAISTKITFSFYNAQGVMVDRETVPMIQDGTDGQGYTQMGKWNSSMVVPKMGVVSMGGGSYVAKVATTNPPLWCWTDNNGNRLIYNAGGYCLTGEQNTAEYDVWAEKGDTGDKGDKGDKGDTGNDGKQGIAGCIIRDSEWHSGVEYRNDEALTSGTRYVDVALVPNNSMATGWDAYKCIKTHVSSTSITTSNTDYWEAFGLNTTAIFTSLIIAKNAKIKFVQGNQLLIQKDDGTVTAGLSGSVSGNKIRIWAGSATPDTAPFRVNEAGELVATKANITGVINAESGVFDNVTIRTGTIAGFSISGTGLTNRNADGTFSNDAYVIFRNDSHNCFAGIGGNVIPATSGIRGVARFENYDEMDWWNLGVNYAMLVGARGAGTNVAINMTGGYISGLAVKTENVSSGKTLDRSVASVACINKAEITITLPTMDIYDDGHIIWIKNMNGSKVNVRPGYSYHKIDGVRTYKESYMHADLGEHFTNNNPNSLPSQGDASAYIYHRDLENGTQYGAWMQYKNPRYW